MYFYSTSSFAILLLPALTLAVPNIDTRNVPEDLAFTPPTSVVAKDVASLKQAITAADSALTTLFVQTSKTSYSNPIKAMFNFASLGQSTISHTLIPIEGSQRDSKPIGIPTLEALLLGAKQARDGANCIRELTTPRNKALSRDVNKARKALARQTKAIVALIKTQNKKPSDFRLSSRFFKQKPNCRLALIAGAPQNYILESLEQARGLFLGALVEASLSIDSMAFVSRTSGNPEAMAFTSAASITLGGARDAIDNMGQALASRKTPNIQDQRNIALAAHQLSQVLQCSSRAVKIQDKRLISVMNTANDSVQRMLNGLEQVLDVQRKQLKDLGVPADLFIQKVDASTCSGFLTVAPGSVTSSKSAPPSSPFRAQPGTFPSIQEKINMTLYDLR